MEIRVGKYCDIFENIDNIPFFPHFRYICRVFAHTLLKLYEIYYQIIVRVYVLCVLGEVLLSKYSCHSHFIAVEMCNLTEVV